MPRPDYVRCEMCVYCDKGDCHVLPGVLGTYDTTPSEFCKHWRSTWPVEYREIVTTIGGQAAISKLNEACSLLLRCSLPRDVSGEAMIDRARALIAEARVQEIGVPERVEVPLPETKGRQDLLNKPITITQDGSVRLAREGDVERGSICQVDKGADNVWYTLDEEGMFVSSLKEVLSESGAKR